MLTETPVENRRLGRIAPKASRNALMLPDFLKFSSLPKKTAHWTRKKPLELRTYGNDRYGDCTIAKQAVAAVRMETIERRGKRIVITDDEVIRVYKEMSDEEYGGGDNGAYEDDALSRWRRPDKTFKDIDGHAYTIDAFLRINPFNHDEVRAGLALSGARGIPVCLNLPAAFANILPPDDWGIPDGQPPVGQWQPGSWGGHSMWARDYDEVGIWLDHTWNLPNQRLTWEAAAIYLDEAHMVIDSVDTWITRKLHTPKVNHVGTLSLKKVVEAVNDVSSYRIGG